MKKWIALLLALVTVFALGACGKKETVSKAAYVGTEELIAGGWEHLQTVHPAPDGVKLEKEIFSTLPAALLAFERGEIAYLCVDRSSADYVTARDEKLVCAAPGEKDPKLSVAFSMLTLDTRQDVFTLLDEAIREIKADGTLDKLIESDLYPYISADPTPAELPVTEGAPSVKVGITGDVPPMDFITADGKAAGFNVALLAEISRRAGVNIELVPIEAGARPIGLTSGKVDAVFWSASTTCEDCGFTWSDAPAGTTATESYFTDEWVKLIAAGK